MQTSSKIIAATLLLILVNLGIAFFYVFRKPHDANPVIVTPVMAVDTLKAKSLYFTPQARACLLSQKPQLLAPDDKDEKSERSLSFGRAAQDPVLWRQLDHNYQFDAILLTGDPVTFQPLLDHLLDSPDWKMTYLDHTSLIFQPSPAREWMQSDLDVLQKKFAPLPKEDRISFLVQLAGKLSAVTEYTLAKHYVDEATTLDPKSPAAQTQLALYYAHFGQWNRVVDKADIALSVDKNYQAALVVKAQGLQAMKKLNEALKISDHLVELAPNDPNILFLHARIAHAAHAYTREIAALITLINIVEQQKMSVSGYRIYLGQAYATTGDAFRALEQFQKALAAGDLSSEQKDYATECVERLKSRM